MSLLISIKADPVFFSKQECLPVGRVQPASFTILEGCVCPGDVCAEGGVCPGGLHLLDQGADISPRCKLGYTPCPLHAGIHTIPSKQND